MANLGVSGVSEIFLDMMDFIKKCLLFEDQQESLNIHRG